MVNKVIEEGGFKYFKCKKCGVVKPLTPLYFYRNSALLTGYTSKCRECVREENSTIYKPKNKPITKAELEEENKKLKEELEVATKCSSQEEGKLRKLEKENKKLKEDLANIQCEFGFECDECEYWKREIKKHKPNLIKEEYVFNLGDYDYMILTSTTPQLKIIKKNNNGASPFTIDGFTAVGKSFSSLTDEEDLYEDVK